MLHCKPLDSNRELVGDQGRYLMGSLIDHPAAYCQRFTCVVHSLAKVTPDVSISIAIAWRIHIVEHFPSQRNTPPSPATSCSSQRTA